MIKDSKYKNKEVTKYDKDGSVIFNKIEYSDGSWVKYKMSQKNGYYENSDGEWIKRQYDEDGNETYYEDNTGLIKK